MSCYYPKLAIPDGINNDTGKPHYTIVGWNENVLRERPDALRIPCGQCIGCRLDSAKVWADRCMMELEYHEEAWFVTLTYDEDHVPEADDSREGERVLTLHRPDFQKFMKRLRFNFGGTIRYFACGEYGEQTMRPHYHAILFGLHLPDLTEKVTRSLGGKEYKYYESPRLNETWGQGFVEIGAVERRCCEYVARYIMKKQKGAEAQVYKDLGIQPEFVVASNRPGIGYQWLLDHPDCLKTDEIMLSTPEGGIRARLPRYFEKVIERGELGEEAIQDLAAYKDRQFEKGLAHQEAIMEKLEIPYPDYLQNQERSRRKRTSILKRDGVL